MGLGFFDNKKPTINADEVRANIALINRFIGLLDKASDNPSNSQARDKLVDLGNKLGEALDQPEITESKKLT
ncbi:hypothetical protein [Legionella feeleii]|uniref:Uncharacterized protein n=1 Tax=Legionella feeleii TaxID=453 RepID=A0A0W0TK33_9GAMM|nr:hypothetical protein [Legionella feeleii]KTC95942.1 hypothetical protein Lfee_2304 [Legionella feeleii]SPX60298.1 Uncharacterised protein [Legionella feeleii]